jgi:hypothetical protein
MSLIGVGLLFGRINCPFEMKSREPARKMLQHKYPASPRRDDEADIFSHHIAQAWSKNAFLSFEP